MSIKKMLEHAAFGLFLDPGLGKTSVTLAAFLILRDLGIVRRMLIVAPLRVCYDVWPSEIEKWADFNGLQLEILHGPKKEERLKSSADIFVINPEGIAWLVDRQRRNKKSKWLSKRKWDWPDMLVVDESTLFKHSGTNRFEALRMVLNNFTRRYILTGTPAPNGYADLWGQLFLLDGGARLGKYITHFRNRFCQRSWTGHGYDIVEGAEERIKDRIKDIVLRLDAEDWLDMPPLIEKTIGVDLPPAARKLYKELEEEYVLSVGDGEVTAVNAGVLSSKLRQCANGRVYLDADGQVLRTAGEAVPKEQRKVGTIHKAKMEAIEELFDELNGQPLMIAYEFQHDLAALKEIFGKDVPVLGAGTTPAQGKKIREAWNRGELAVMLAHPASAGHGLNLQDGGHHMAWYSETWNLEHFDQMIRRQWRQGQTKPVFVYHIVARHTIDQKVVTARGDKDFKQKDLLNFLKETPDD